MPKIPRKNATCAVINPIESIPPWRSSTKDTSIITPEEKPRVKAMNLGPGSLTKMAITLPMVVERPAKVASKMAVRNVPSVNIYKKPPKSLEC
jgi:hypothetical protein